MPEQEKGIMRTTQRTGTVVCSPSFECLGEEVRGVGKEVRVESGKRKLEICFICCICFFLSSTVLISDKLY